MSVAAPRRPPTTPHPAAFPHRVRGQLGGALLLLSAPLLLGAVVGHLGLGRSDPAAAPTTDTATLLGHNLLVAGLAASGLLTVGLGTVLAMVPAWFLVGTQVGASVLHHGVDLTARGLLVHGVVELAGFVCAMAVGLAPPAHVAARLRGGPAPLLRRRLTDAGALAGLAVLLLTAGAVLETGVTPLLLTASTP